MPKRNRAFYRYQRNRTINRKLGILQRIGGMDLIQVWTKGKPGKLAKGKIHCSCSLCRLKTYEYPPHCDKKEDVAARQQWREIHFGL